MGAPRFALVASLGMALASGVGAAQVPGPIQDVSFDGWTTLGWSAEPSADFYNVYRGALSELSAGMPARCHGYRIESTTFETSFAPPSGDGFFYLVTGESTTTGEGTPGFDSNLNRRPLLGACGPVMRTHTLDRLGYGWSEWSRDRIDALDLEGYVAEQLAPSTIDESTNLELNSRLAAIDPPVDIVQLVQQQVIRAVYARRQLEQQVATFWTNHFSTYWVKIAEIYQSVYPPCQQPGIPSNCDIAFPAKAFEEASRLQNRELEQFRDLAFNGNFRELVEASTLSPAMIIYLDTYASIAGAPNENFPRELMELYAMGVDGGYTQTDVEELSRVITGWTVCKKQLADLDDPLAPCIEAYWQPFPEGEWVAHFRPEFHDCSSKTLFADTPEEVTLPESCGSPHAQLNDLNLALDAIVGHPSTAEFISKKLLQRFVTDAPDPASIDQLVAVWNDPGNPQGVGDNRAVLEAALSSSLLLDPDRTGGKIKTPLEHVAGALRGTRGYTDGATGVINFLVRAQHIPHYNPIPTGWPEDGASWIGTNNTLERQNVGIQILNSPSPVFGADPLDLLLDNGVSTAPGNSQAIIDFFSDVFFGGALTPAERQVAIEHLDTNDDGTPTPYNDQRILEAIGLLMGYPQYQEQ